MPHTIDLYDQLPAQYHHGYRIEGDEVYIGTAKTLAYRLTRDDGIDGHTRRTRVIAPAALRDTNLIRAIELTMTTGNCHHEHDCCGCPSTYAIARRVSRREYAVEVHTTYNV